MFISKLTDAVLSKRNMWLIAVSGIGDGEAQVSERKGRWRDAEAAAEVRRDGLPMPAGQTSLTM